MDTKRNLKSDSSKSALPALPLRLMERLCNAVGVSGDEGEVRKIVIEEIKPYADGAEVSVDALGNVLARRQGKAEKRLKVMLAAHLDEVGLMITRDENNGFFRFEGVGGVDKRLLVGKAVWVGQDHIPGVIGAKPIHLTSDEELKNTISVDDMRIDVGGDNKGKVKVGDRATYAFPFQRMGASLRGKALDDRLGVAMLIELFKQPFPQLDVLAAFTVQEEVGLRGAGVAAYALEPDVAIVLDCTPAYDLPHWENEGGKTQEHARYNTRLGGGAAIYVADGDTLSDPRLLRHLVETAEACNIPYQIRQPGGGGTDAGAIHVSREGIPAISVSVPARYIHTSAGIARAADWQNTQALLRAALERLTPEILAQAR